MKSMMAVYQFNGFNPAAAGNLPATGAGVWSAFGGRGTFLRQGSFQTWTDDANTRYFFIAYGRATSLTAGVFPYWSARLYDVTNAQVVIGPTNANSGSPQDGQVHDAYFGWCYIAQFGPLGTLPVNMAGLRFQYTGGGNGAALYAAYLFVERTV